MSNKQIKLQIETAKYFDDMDKDMIGIWAGIVWRTLNERGNMSIHELQQTTGLEYEAIYFAVGWLAREDKISFGDNEELSLYIYHERYY